MVYIIIFIMAFIIIYLVDYNGYLKSDKMSKLTENLCPLFFATIITIIMYALISKAIAPASFSTVEFYTKIYNINEMNGSYHYIDSDTHEFVVNIGSTKYPVYKNTDMNKTIKELGSEDNCLMVDCISYKYSKLIKVLFFVSDREIEQDYRLLLTERVVE